MKRIVGAGAVLLAATGLLGACGEERAADAGRDGSGTSVAGSPTASPTASPGEDAPVVPASGLELAIEGLSVRVPEGWVRAELVLDIPNTADAETPDKSQSVSITAPLYRVGDDLDREQLEANMRRDDFRVLEPTEIAGHTFARGVRRERGRVTLRHVAVVDHVQRAVSLYFEGHVPPEEQEAVTASVLATVELG
ncbi:hypothetical protein [Nocardioides solisilvae]|uniref:hypothetical protein n=1 Tax=Nocardioides solisilvae TaxID=1542435 RepID=UPI000D74208C|nr:hypothetical protein [Nocardioides solisilvae]